MADGASHPPGASESGALPSARAHSPPSPRHGHGAHGEDAVSIVGASSVGATAGDEASERDVPWDRVSHAPTDEGLAQSERGSTHNDEMGFPDADAELDSLPADRHSPVAADVGDADASAWGGSPPAAREGEGVPGGGVSGGIDQSSAWQNGLVEGHGTDVPNAAASLALKTEECAESGDGGDPVAMEVEARVKTEPESDPEAATATGDGAQAREMDMTDGAGGVNAGDAGASADPAIVAGSRAPPRQRRSTCAFAAGQRVERPGIGPWLFNAPRAIEKAAKRLVFRKEDYKPSELRRARETYISLLESTANFNARILVNRTQTVPFLDQSTGTLQYADRWIPDAADRIVGKPTDKEAIVYPRRRWRLRAPQPPAPPATAPLPAVDAVRAGDRAHAAASPMRLTNDQPFADDFGLLDFGPMTDAAGPTAPVAAVPGTLAHGAHPALPGRATTQPTSIPPRGYVGGMGQTGAQGLPGMAPSAPRTAPPVQGNAHPPRPPAAALQAPAGDKEGDEDGSPTPGIRVKSLSNSEIARLPLELRVKPYECVVCKRRYKNAPGLAYHYNHHDHGDMTAAQTVAFNAVVQASREQGGAPPIPPQQLVAIQQQHAQQEALRAQNMVRPQSGRPVQIRRPSLSKPLVCVLCAGTASSGRNGMPEALISCRDCHRSCHPSCLGFSESTAVVIATYAWQCNECKACEVCGKTTDEDKLLFCDACDRGYHTFCLVPPVRELPTGPWLCSKCGGMPGGGAPPAGDHIDDIFGFDLPARLQQAAYQQPQQAMPTSQPQLHPGFAGQQPAQMAYAQQQAGGRGTDFATVSMDWLSDVAPGSHVQGLGGALMGEVDPGAQHTMHSMGFPGVPTGAGGVPSSGRVDEQTALAILKDGMDFVGNFGM